MYKFFDNCKEMTHWFSIDTKASEKLNVVFKLIVLIFLRDAIIWLGLITTYYKILVLLINVMYEFMRKFISRSNVCIFFIMTKDDNSQVNKSTIAIIYILF